MPLPSFFPPPYPGEREQQYLNRLKAQFNLHDEEVFELTPYLPSITRAVTTRHFSRAPMSGYVGARQPRTPMSRAPSLRSAQYSYAARMREVQRRQRMAGFRVTNFSKALLQKAAGELRGMDTILTNASIVGTTNTNDDIQCLNLIETGNGSWNRNGRKAFLKSLRLKGTVTGDLAAAATTYDVGSTYLRMIVVWDKQPSGGTIPTFDTIFGYTTQDGTESVTTMSNLRYDNTGRFSVLKEHVFVPPPVAPLGAAAQASYTYHIPFDFFIDLKNRTTIYSGDSDPVTIADISSGSLLLVWRADAAGQNWSVDDISTARLRFTC